MLLMGKITDVSAIIEALGGTCAVAKIFDIEPPSVSEWKKNGEIPRARLMYLQLARPDVFGIKAKKVRRTKSAA